MSNDENSEDILKKLREVRKKLQESLSEDESSEFGKPKAPDTSKILVEGQEEIEKEDKARLIEKKAETLKKPKLYKAGQAPTKQISPKKLKKAPTKIGLSAKKMAGIQKRIQQKVAATKRMSNKKRALLIVAMILATLPIFAVSTLAMATCEFDMDNVQFAVSSNTRNENITDITVFIPTHNPNILPATISSLEMKLTDFKGNHVGSLLLLDPVVIPPKGTTRLGLTVKLNQEEASTWLTEMMQTWTFRLQIEEIEYNGVKMPGSIKLPEMEMTSLIDMLLGLFGYDMDTIVNDLLGDLGGLFAMPNGHISDELAEKIFQVTGKNPNTGKIDPIRMAYFNGGFKGLEASQDLSEMYLDINEELDAFSINLSLPFEIDAIEGFDLGRLNIWDLDIGIYVDDSPNFGSNDINNYDYKLIEIKSQPSNRSTKIINGLPDFGDISIYFGGPEGSSEANVFINITKDKITGSEHPSRSLDWDNETMVQQFLQDANQKYPLWYFFYNLLVNGKIDCLLKIEHISLQVLGLTFKDIYVPADLIGPIELDVEELMGDLLSSLDLSSLFAGPPVFTPVGSIALLTQLMGTGGMIFPKYLDNIDQNPNGKLESSEVVDIENLDIEEILDMDALDTEVLLSSIEEVIGGPDAHLGLTIPLGIKAFPIDLCLGFKGGRIGLSNQIGDYYRDFAVVTLSGNNSDEVYINGYNSSAFINITLMLYTNSTMQPHVVKFLRDLIEKYTIDATVKVHFDNLILFAENYSLPSYDLELPIAMDLGDLVDSLLGDLLSDLMGGDLSDLFASLFNADQPNPLHLSGNPFTFIQEFALNLGLFNPVMGYLASSSGQEWLESDMSSLESSQIMPDASQDFDLEITKLGNGWKIKVVVPDLNMSDLLADIPITIGVGYAQFDMYAKNQYDDWAKMMTLSIDNYFILQGLIDLAITITIYNNGPLCDFLSDLMEVGVFNLKLDGTATLSISGIYLPDLHLGITMEDIDMGFNMTSLMEAIVDSLSNSSSQNAIDVINAHPLANSKPEWWNGDISQIPLVSQLDDLSQYIEIGDFNIYEMKETGWPYVDQGNVTLTIGLEILNKLMDLSITQLSVVIWSDDPTLNSSKKMVEVTAPPVDLVTGLKAELKTTLLMYKSHELEAWMKNIMENFKLTGYITANFSMRIFGCDIGPIELPPQLALNLTQLVPNMTDLLVSLLTATIPLAHKEARVGDPDASQDITDIIGKFAAMYVTMPADTYNPNAGPQNWNEPMMDVRAGLALMPNLNLSILDTNIALLDANIYNAIYDPVLNNREEAEHYSLMANLTFVPEDIYCNNTYSRPGNPYGGIYNQTIDPDKPWYIPGPEPGTGTIYYYDPNDPNAKPYHLGTYYQFEASIKVYNISYGTYETRYPKHLWRKLGGPYFPVLTFGPEYGGYPNHRKEYHKYFSPTYNILNGLLNGLDLTNLESLDPTQMMSNIRLTGHIKLNIFSITFNLDLGSEIVSNLMSTVLGMFSLGMAEWTRNVVNPFGGLPLPAFRDKNGNPTEFSKEPGLPEPAEGFDNMAINIFAFLHGVKLGAVLERNDHLFCPQYGWGGSNIHPWTPGYHAGVYDPVKNPTASNIENFVKDRYYENFKIITENYRKSVNLPYNPYFEVFDENNQYINDPSNWALRWQSASGRTRTDVIVIIVALGLKIPIGILSAYMPLWMDGQRPCTIEPFGYIYINESVNLIPVDEGSAVWENWQENASSIDDNGKPPDPGIYLTINIRGFEGPAYYSYWENLLFGFNLRMIISGIVNISLFGYELYNIQFNPMELGDKSQFYTKCDEYQQQHGGSSYVYDLPNLDGTVNPSASKDEEEFPPEEFIPEYAEFDIMDVINLDGLVDSLFGGSVWDIIQWVFSHISIDSIDQQGITIKTKEIEVEAALSAIAWLETIDITIKKNTVQNSDPDKIPPEYWTEIGYIVSDQWTELTEYPGSNIDPYKFDVNPLANINFHAHWVLKPIEIRIEWDVLGGIDVLSLLWHLAVGPKDIDTIRGDLGGYVYLTLDPLIVNLGLPIEFDYHFGISINSSDVTFELADLIAGDGGLF
ncbi:MAG: hypothetical protein ACTSRZ_13290 [Promethearchaeota archaeon]